MKPLLIIGALLIQSMLYACGGINQQVYSGQIEYRFDSSDPFTCIATITMDFDIDETLPNDSIWVNWGDGDVIIMRAITITKDTVASANTGSANIYTHVYSGRHTYTSLPAGGYYYISFQNQYRINGVSNIASGDGVNLPFYLMAQVSIDTAAGGSYQPLAFPPLTIGFANFESYTQSGLAQVSDGDSVSYAFNTPLETVSNPVPEYQLPDQFCQANGSSENMFTMDAVTGKVLWNSPCLQGVYCFGTLLNKYRNGSLISSIMREQNIYVSATYVSGIRNIKKDDGLVVYPNPVQQTLVGTINIASPGADDRLEIIAPDGRLVASNIAIEDGRFETDISQLSNGVYILHLQSASEALTIKFVKQ